MATSDSDPRQLDATDAMLAEDTNSKGRISQMVRSEVFRGFFVWLPD